MASTTQCSVWSCSKSKATANLTLNPLEAGLDLSLVRSVAWHPDDYTPWGYRLFQSGMVPISSARLWQSLAVTPGPGWTSRPPFQPPDAGGVPSAARRPGSPAGPREGHSSAPKPGRDPCASSSTSSRPSRSDRPGKTGTEGYGPQATSSGNYRDIVAGAGD